MKSFEELNEDRIFSKSIENYLLSTKWEYNTPIYKKTPETTGLCKWFCSDYDYHVCITKDKLYIYKEYDCGGYVADWEFDVDEIIKRDFYFFTKWIEEIFRNVGILERE